MDIDIFLICREQFLHVTEVKVTEVKVTEVKITEVKVTEVKVTEVKVTDSGCYRCDTHSHTTVQIPIYL